MEQEKGLLEGVVVLDLTRVLAGPYCGALMADMGATVIKVEQPGKGDDSRSMGPFVNDQSVYYANFNRSKMGVTLNLKDPEAKEIFKEMVKKADVVIENYRPGTMEKLGLGYDVLKEINPGIIYGACSGFGHTGPYSKRAGYDIVGQAMGGLMSTTGWPGGPATRCGTPMGDVLGGLNLTVGVLAALVNKQKTGLGEKVDVALVDSVASAMENIAWFFCQVLFVGGSGGILVQTTLQSLGYEVELVDLAVTELPIAIIAIVLASVLFIMKDKKLTKKYYGDQNTKAKK